MRHFVKKIYEKWVKAHFGPQKKERKRTWHLLTQDEQNNNIYDCD